MIRFLAASLLVSSLFAQEVTNLDPEQAPVIGKEKQDPNAVPPQVAPKAPAEPMRSNPWFPVVEKNLGTYMSHEEAKGVFKFKNPNQEAQSIRHLQPSCACSKILLRVGARHFEYGGQANPGQIFETDEKGGNRKLVKEIPVAAGEEGEVEIHMEMTGVIGLRSATLDLHLTDPTLPLAKIKFEATGAQMYLVSPAEVNLNTMTWAESREFQVTVTSPILKDFNIVRMDEAGKDFKVTYEKAMDNGAARWVIKGTYGPVSAESGSGGMLRFFTDQANANNFQVRVAAFVKGPLEVRPGAFLSLGMIRKGTARKQQVVFEPNDQTDLQATSITFDKLTVPQEFVSCSQSKDGKKLVLELNISDQAPAGMLRGNIVVKTNHPGLPEKVLMFNGYVR